MRVYTLATRTSQTRSLDAHSLHKGSLESGFRIQGFQILRFGVLDSDLGLTGLRGRGAGWAYVILTFGVKALFVFGPPALLGRGPWVAGIRDCKKDLVNGVFGSSDLGFLCYSSKC